jgi:hypothetical protein
MGVNGRAHDEIFPRKGLRFDWTLNLGTLLTLGVIIVTALAAWTRVAQRLTMIESIERQTNRMEHYLESKDPEYWKQAAQNGDR